MGKGSSIGNGRRMYNFSLNENDPDDQKLIAFLEKRSTTHCVRDALKLFMDGFAPQQPQPQQINQDALSLLVGLISGNANQNLSQMAFNQQNIPQSVPNVDENSINSSVPETPQQSEKEEIPVPQTSQKAKKEKNSTKKEDKKNTNKPIVNKKETSAVENKVFKALDDF